MPQRAVIDANVAIASVVRIDDSSQALRCLERLLRSGTELLVPSLWHDEILTTRRRLLNAGRLTHAEAGARIETLMHLNLRSRTCRRMASIGRGVGDSPVRHRTGDGSPAAMDTRHSLEQPAGRRLEAVRSLGTDADEQPEQARHERRVEPECPTGEVAA